MLETVSIVVQYNEKDYIHTIFDVEATLILYLLLGWHNNCYIFLFMYSFFLCGIIFYYFCFFYILLLFSSVG